ncbi:MAG TPA: xanthine dehydrogenase family protein molybdopterin-binding subunit [Candidatus Dormibacteraeota bacterium]|nr:xanthine dehydrogenase family protein molybdopterin-binding subunit [Candidatus Dormibacteraeota bacterium]
MAPYIGRRMRRVEDERLITGTGRYAGDIKLEGLVHVAFARSPLPHARILAVDLSQAKQMPGVIAVWTADDLSEAAFELTSWGPEDLVARPRKVLNRDEVNYVGEAFAVVVAETEYQARDAADQVVGDLDPLPSVGDTSVAAAEDAPKVHDDTDDNFARRHTTAWGDIDTAFAGDSVTAKIHLTTSRIAGAAMEPRAVTAAPDGDGLKVWTSTQNIFGVREAISEALGLKEENVRVLAEDVGGGFGAKGMVYPEEVLTAAVARHLNRPASWVASRSEDGATTAQAHGSVIELEIASDREGKLRGLRGRLVHDLGAYSGSGAGQPDLIVMHMMSAYVLPAMNIEAQIVYTNTVPTGFIRGGGRPLGNYAIERLMDRLALALNFDRVQLRRRNMISPDQIPYKTNFPAGRRGLVYDSGDYPRLLDLVVNRLGDASKLDDHDGRLVGVGIVCCVESTSFGRDEPARLRINQDGTAHLWIGSTPGGQGHQTIAAQVAADRLGWPIEKISVTAGDTSHVPSAELTAGSRTAVQVGNATAKAGIAMRRLILERAGEVLEADPVDLLMEEGVISVKGAPSKRIPVTDVVPREGLEVLETFDPARGLTFSSGCHAAAVAVDPETGQVEVLRYVIAHDTGKPINEQLVEGQMHGGYAHGLGYALYESAMYDSDGSFRTATFIDYTIVSAGEVASVPELIHIDTPTDSNPEGFKGAGESGTIPVPAAIANAVEDALRKRKPDAVIDHLPITSDRIVEILAK